MPATPGKARLRLGIVGAGKHGSRYARHAARDVEGLELAAVCRRDETLGGALADELDCDFEVDALALVRRRDIDVVVLCTVPALLPELVGEAVAAGKRLVVEKPVARSVDEGLVMLEAIEKAGLYCMAAHTLRFNSAVLALRREIPTLGRVDSFLFSQRFPPQLDLGWLDTPQLSGGGNVLHTGVHAFDLLRWLGGCEIAAAAARIRRVRTRDTEDHFVASLETATPGLLAQVACSRATDSRNGLIEVSGEHGQLVVDHVLGTGYRLGPRGREELATGEPAMTVKTLLERLVDDARRDAAPAIPYRDGLAAVAVAEACYRSADSGRFETVRSVPGA